MNQSPRPMKIGIVGAGGIVRQRHAPGLMELKNVHISAIANSTVESGKRFAAEWSPDARIFDDWRELISDGDCDVIWIGATPNLHCEVTCAALRAGKHVFCQARMARNLEEAELMLKVSQEHPELVTALCPPPMGMRADRAMKAMLAKGKIGTPHQIRLQSLNAMFLSPVSPAHWRQRRDISGLQVLTFGIYVEVLHRWFGPISSVSVHGGIVHPNRNGLTVEIPDFLHVLCSFDSGLEGTLAFSGVTAHAPGDQLEVYGDRGTIIYDFTKESLQLGISTDPQLKEYAPAEELLDDWTVERDFVEAVRDPEATRPKPDFEEGLAYMQVVEAAHESLLRGRRISVKRSRPL